MHRDMQYLSDILDSAEIALSHVSKKNADDFGQDIQCQDAVIRRIEIIGEAANRISDATQSKYEQLPWHQMIGMRNMMIHKYDSIDLEIVWDTVQRDLPPLVALLKTILND
jgi:uncharacterized protein with HEPN domain